eukprot:2754347-Prymnesium_polylepis.1
MVQTRGPHRTRCGHTERHRSEVCSDRTRGHGFTNLCKRGHAPGGVRAQFLESSPTSGRRSE